MSVSPLEMVTGNTDRRTVLAVGLSILMLVSMITAVGTVPARGAPTTTPTTAADQADSASGPHARAPAETHGSRANSTVASTADVTFGNDSRHAQAVSTTTGATAATITRPSVRPDQPTIRWGGRTIAVDVHPEDPSIALAASESGGLFKTTDGGTNWTHLGGANLPHRLSDVRFAPSNPDVIILSAHADSRRLRRDGRVISGGGIWRSTDGGDTWNKPASGEPPESFPCSGNATTQAIAFEPNTTNVYVGTECSLAISHDLGATWEHIRVGPDRENRSVSTVISPAEGIVDVGTAGTGHYRYNTTNETWQPNSLPASFVWNSPQSLAVSPSDPDVLFAVVQERDRSCGTRYNISRTLYESADGGESWSMVNYPDRCDFNRPPFVATPPVATNGSFDVFVGNGDDTFRQENCSGPGSPQCENATSAWSEVSVDHADQIDIAYPADSACPLFMANDGGIEKTTDCGATWHNVGNSSKRGGYNALQFYKVSGQIWADHTDLHVGTQDNSIWASPDGGDTWPNAHSNEGGWLSMARYGTDHDTEVITGEAEAGQFQTNPHLDSPSAWPNPPNISTGSSKGSKPYFVEEGVYLQWSNETSGNRTLWLTNDTGSTWRKVISLRDPAIRGNPVVGPPDDPTMYAPYDRSSGIGLWKITNIRGAGPANATKVAGDIGSLAIHVRGQGTFDFRRVVGADPNDPDHVIAVDADAEAVKVSHDGGKTWETDGELTSLVTDDGRYEMLYGSKRGTNEERRTRQSQVTTIAFDPVPESDRILVGTEDAGVIISNDGGDSWHRIEGSRRMPAITSFFFDNRTGNDATRDVYASTYGRGLWRVDPTGGIGGCGWINSSGAYDLTEDLAAGNEEPCLFLNASNVILDGNNHTIRGVGPGATNAYPIVAFNGSARDFPFLFPPPAPISGVTVRDLEVANWARPIQFVNIEGTLVDNVVVRDSFGVTASLAHGRGLRYIQGDNHDVVDTRLVNLSSIGLDVSKARNVRVVDSNVSDNDAQGILIDGGNDLLFRGNDIGNNLHGILTSRPEELSIVDNVVRSNDRNGLKLQGMTDSRVRGNTVTGNSHGINIVGRNSEDNTVAGNHVFENRQIGIRIKESERSVVRNNIVRRNAWDGINLWSAGGSVARDNVVVGNLDGDGIVVNNAGNVTARDNYIADHTSGDSYGIRLKSDVGSFRAVGNVIRNNTHGILLEPYASGSATVRRNRIVDSAESGVVVPKLTNIAPVGIHDNAISGNGAFGVESGWENKVVNATGNWWGHPSGPGSPGTPLTDPVSGALANGTGDTVTENASNAGVSNVRFDPWGATGFTYTDLSVQPRSVAAGQSIVATVDVGNPVDITVEPAWRQFRANPRHTGHINTSGPTRPSAPRWTFVGDGEITASPAVVNGTVYIGSNDAFDAANMYALDARTGAVRWNVSIFGDRIFSPAVFNGSVYVGSDTALYALDAKTGARRWSFTTGTFSRDFESSPTVVGDTVYIGDNDHKIYALDARTGAERWNASTGADVRSSPAVANGTVFVGDDAGNLYALNTTTGAVRWNASLRGKVRSSPAVSEDTVYVGSGKLDSFDPRNGSVYAINATTGTIQWNFTTEAGVRSSPAVANGTVFIGTSDDGESLYALNATTGVPRWTFTPEFGIGIGTSPAVVDGTVYVESDDGIAGYDAETGRLLWEYGDLLDVTSPAVLNGTVYVGSDLEQTVFALHADTVAPTIDNATLIDITDGDGIVSDGDRIEITANVSDDGVGVDRVGATASAFGAGLVELTDGDRDGIYNATVVVDASQAAVDGSYPVSVAANDTANNTVSAETNELELDREAGTTPTPTAAAPISIPAPGFRAPVTLLALLLVALLAIRRY